MSIGLGDVHAGVTGPREEGTRRGPLRRRAQNEPARRPCPGRARSPRSTGLPCSPSASGWKGRVLPAPPHARSFPMSTPDETSGKRAIPEPLAMLYLLPDDSGVAVQLLASPG